MTGKFNQIGIILLFKNSVMTLWTWNKILCHNSCGLPTLSECDTRREQDKLKYVGVCSADLFTLAVEVDEGVAGRRNVLRCHTLVHAIDVEVKTTVGVHQQTQHRPLRTSVQIRTIVLTSLRKKGD